ncbi:hypothetical protein HF1_06620 [Mycoplasma haemofelis str. Langford 1]|uniref:Uncharacterized protein n=2 Tax=Mycoplasma haemofelis TaxID=29501 RepID=F6FIF5_MYCHI|nr:hypothetical protein [Mycoplasma haemofelis]AEG73003.1 hypothetical protein MHF_0733 [Mycoplasma haemofelis Ohio2]CBY92670.1 hypothetical protein HF1_06620 [Mycoplasma haemofelis str. Langford 1]
MGSFESDGESKLKILFEVIGKPRFKEFMTQVSTMVSKNPNLMSSLKDNDVMDVLSAFRQDEDTVVDTLKNLNTEGEGKVDRDKLMNALKLYSLMDRAKSMQSKAQSVIAKQDKEAAKALVTEIQKILGEIKGIIDSQEQQATE